MLSRICCTCRKVPTANFLQTVSIAQHKLNTFVLLTTSPISTDSQNESKSNVKIIIDQPTQNQPQNSAPIIQPKRSLFSNSDANGDVKINRVGLHRAVFAAAGCYNIGWGIYSALYPQWFFELTELPLINHPQIFSCLAMSIGIYGILYLEVARKPERGWLLAAVGLTGKVLGPIGMVSLIASGEWPLSAIAMCIPNDFMWWIPFGMYLKDAWPAFIKDLKSTITLSRRLKMLLGFGVLCIGAGACYTAYKSVSG